MRHYHRFCRWSNVTILVENNTRKHPLSSHAPLFSRWREINICGHYISVLREEHGLERCANAMAMRGTIYTHHTGWHRIANDTYGIQISPNVSSSLEKGRRGFSIGERGFWWLECYEGAPVRTLEGEGEG